NSRTRRMPLTSLALDWRSKTLNVKELQMPIFLKTLAINLLATLFPTKVIAKSIVTGAKALAEKTNSKVDDEFVKVLEDNLKEKTEDATSN
ncbi:hypothetical protein, partial [Staphylococcus aureus]